MEEQPRRLEPRDHLQSTLEGQPKDSPLFRALRDAVKWRLANRQVTGTSGHGSVIGQADERTILERRIGAERSGPQGDVYGPAFDDEKTNATHLKHYLERLNGLVDPEELVERAGGLMLNDLTAINETLPEPTAGPNA